MVVNCDLVSLHTLHCSYWFYLSVSVFYGFVFLFVYASAREPVYLEPRLFARCAISATSAINCCFSLLCGSFQILYGSTHLTVSACAVTAAGALLQTFSVTLSCYFLSVWNCFTGFKWGRRAGESRLVWKFLCLCLKRCSVNAVLSHVSSPLGW